MELLTKQQNTQYRNGEELETLIESTKKRNKHKNLSMDKERIYYKMVRNKVNRAEKIHRYIEVENKFTKIQKYIKGGNIEQVCTTIKGYFEEYYYQGNSQVNK